MGMVLLCGVPLAAGSPLTDCPAASQVWESLDGAMDLNAIGLTPDVVASAFFWGFTTVGFCWMLGYVLAVVIEAIRKL